MDCDLNVSMFGIYFIHDVVVMMSVIGYVHGMCGWRNSMNLVKIFYGGVQCNVLM